MAILFSLLMTGLYLATYCFLFFLFPKFFGFDRPRLSKRSIPSLALIALLSVLAYVISYAAHDADIGNRILHGFGGGFLAFLMCYCVVHDTRIRLTAFQFFAVSFLIVTALGVANELMEFTLQHAINYTFADTVNDTWLDLTSNTIGALIASALFVPLLKQRA